MGSPKKQAQGGLGSVEPNDIMVWGSASAGIHNIEVETLSFVGPALGRMREAESMNADQTRLATGGIRSGVAQEWEQESAGAATPKKVGSGRKEDGT